MKQLYILILLAALTLQGIAQVRSVSGTVSDAKDGTTLPGVSVTVKGTSSGIITDINGKYDIKVPDANAILVFRFIGYKAFEATVGAQKVINVKMIVESKMLDEVVVIGYGVVRKSDLTGSVSSVKTKDIVKITSLNPEQSLQGRVSGVQVTSTSGAPGAAPAVRVRGVGTFNNSAPIYVVDGVILDNISFLNAADIASMEILKDASSTAIYGSRGANGVILITTKSGKIGEEKTTFSYTGEYGVQKLAKKINLLNGREYATVANLIKPGSYNNVDMVPNTDWQDLVFHNAAVTSHQLSATGATKTTQYYIGLGYYKQDGIIDKSNYERITLKLNNVYNLTKFLKLGNNLTFAPYKQQNAPNVTYQVYRALPVIKPYLPDSLGGGFAGVTGVGNPLADLAYSNNYNKGIRAVGNFFLEANFLKHFSLRTSYGLDGLYNQAVSFTPAYAVLMADGTASMQNNTRSDLFKGSNTNMTWLWENTLSYNQTFGKHAIDAIAGFTAQEASSEYFAISGEDILRDGKDFWYMNGNYLYIANKYDHLKDLGNGVDDNLNYAMISYLFRANYTYNSKYILTATFRRDGSSKFYKENRYGNFPSFALGWNLSKEDFMKDIPYLSNLKIRSSWGKIGNEKIPYSDRFSLTQDLLAVFGIGDLSFPAVSYAKNGNPDLKWETTTQTDVGIEFGLFNNKFTAELDYYHRITDDILVQLSTPGHMGNGLGQKVRYNAGQVLNSGFEYNLNWREKIGDFSYSIGFLGSTVHNEVLSVGGNSGVDSLLYGGDYAGFLTQSREGLPIGSFWGYQTNGIFQTQAELNAYPHDGQAQVGDLRRVDINKDGVINSLDKTNLGSPIPTFIFGFNGELGYKNFDFSFSIQGQTGNKIFNAKEIVRPDPYNFENHILNAWTGQGTSNTEPRATNGGYNYIPSDKYIQDGSFVRLRSVVFGYTLPKSISQKIYASSLRFYVKGDNLMTRTKFTGYSPEIASQDVLSNGIDMGVYPISAIYSFGVNLNF
ncbi:MAG: TonB-dependent receptor [Bacteroidota bacterium]